MSKQKEFKCIKHVDKNGFVGYFDKNHSNQKCYKDSGALWLCTSAMSKCQIKLGVTEETVSTQKLFILLARNSGIDIVLSDVDRTKEETEQPNTAITEQPQPVDALANTTDKLQIWINEQIQAGYTPEQLIQSLKDGGYTKEVIGKYFDKKKFGF